MKYGLHHRNYARNLGQSSAGPGVFSQFPNPYLIQASPGTAARPYNVSVLVPKSTTPTVQVGADSAPAICLDSKQNAINCSDPNCTYGDCNAPVGTPQVTVGALCLDQQENQIDCSDPNCTYGDCQSSMTWLGRATILPPIPDIALLLGAAVLLGAVTGGRR